MLGTRCRLSHRSDQRARRSLAGEIRLSLREKRCVTDAKVVAIEARVGLVGFDERVFLGIRDDFASVARLLGVDDVVAIPLSALQGDNVVERSEHTAWYDGPTLRVVVRDDGCGGAAPGSASGSGLAGVR